MRSPILSAWIILLTGLFTHLSAYAYQPESLDRLEELAKAFISANTKVGPSDRLEVKLGSSAAELQIPKCSGNIDVSLPENASINQPNTLIMHCTGQEAWQVYLPVSSHLFTKVIVAKQPIPSHQIIDSTQLDYAEMDRNQLYSGYFTDISNLVGQVATTTISTGSVVNRRNTQAPTVIHRNQIVSIIAKHGPIMVKAEGVAKSDGAVNDTIPVYNPSSKRTIEGIIQDASTVEAI